MKSAIRLFLIGSLIGLLMLTVSLPVCQPGYGQSAKERKMDENRSKRDKLYGKIKQLNGIKGPLADEIAVLDEKIEHRQTEIENITSQLEEKKLACEKLKEEQIALEENLVDQKSILADRIRAVYMQGELTYLDILFQASSFSDVIDRLYFVQAIVARDQELVAEAEEMQLELDKKISQISTQIEEIDRIKQEIEKAQNELEDEKSSKQISIEAINNDAALAERQIRELEEENKKIKAELLAIQNSRPYKGKPWSGSFAKPCAGTITSGFGYRIHPILKRKKMHTGVDIATPKGTAVKAAGDGKVIYRDRRGGYGKCIMIDHGGGKVTLYAHLSAYSCNTGNMVSVGDKIGEVGSTGISTGNHLHFEVRINGDPVNPLDNM